MHCVPLRENAMIDWQMKFGMLMIVDVLLPSIPCNPAQGRLIRNWKNDTALVVYARKYG
jgi:hypothetical protein